MIHTGFRNNQYCTVWTVEPGRGNFTKARISITRRDKNTGEYVQDFSGFITLIGQAHAKAQRLKERDRIKLLEVDVSNRYDKERNREYTDFKVFDFEFAESSAGAPGATTAPAPAEGDNPSDGSEEELPF